jgi:hypothetical protein
VPLAASVLRAHHSKEGIEVKACVRLSAIVLGIVMGLMASTAGPAAAAQGRDHVVTRDAAPTAHLDGVSGPGTPPPAVAAREVPLRTPRVTTDGCGFLQLCLFFSRSEQRWIGGATVSAVAALVCSSGLACGISAAVAYTVIRYIDSHGICPTSRPRLRVKVFPTLSPTSSCVA